MSDVAILAREGLHLGIFDPAKGRIHHVVQSPVAAESISLELILLMLLKESEDHDMDGVLVSVIGIDSASLSLDVLIDLSLRED